MKNHATRIRAVAVGIIVAGSLMLGTPATVSASGDDVCCQVGGGPRCCGGACNATSSFCEACTTFWGCFFF